MTPLSIEIYNPAAKRWNRVGEVKPGGPPGSISHNKPDSNRELYIFGCSPDDSKSTIYRSGAGIDLDLGKLREAVIDESKLEIVKELRRNESFEMEVKTDRSPQPRLIRLTHK